MYSSILLGAAYLFPIALARPQAVNNTLSNSYILTAYAPGNATYNGLKAEYNTALNLFQQNTSSYCPLDPASACPNGTEVVFGGAMYPISEVPGGQDSYVQNDGLIQITVQHEHTIPAGAYWGYQGFNWTALPASEQPSSDCPSNNTLYNCAAPTGYINWNLNGTGGLRICPNEYNPDLTSLYAVTPNFTRTDCVELLGLGTHNYTGPNPPVWSYY